MTVVRASLRNFLAHKGRMILSAIAVLLSVAFVCGTLVFTDTMNTTFNKMFSDTAPDVTVSSNDADAEDEWMPSAVPATIPASLQSKLEQADGVESAQGGVMSMSVTVVDADNDNIGSTTGAPTIAGNWTSQDAKTMEITSGRAPQGPGDVLVDADTADKHDLEIGDELRAISSLGDHRAKISGIGTFKVTNPGAAMVFYDTRTAQENFLGATDAFTNFWITVEDGVSHEEAKKGALAAIGADYKVQTKAEWVEENEDAMGSFLDVIKYAMLGFAGIAFLVGIFLIVNTFSMLVAQRTREIGLMRAIGSSRKQVNRSVLIEAVLLGIVGSVLGVGAGIGLAVGLMKLMGAVGLNLSTSDLTVAWATPVIGLVLGILVTVLAAYLPARRAGKVSPMAALRDETTSSDGRVGKVRVILGLLLTLGGGAALATTFNADDAVGASGMLGLGVLGTLLGFVMIGPLLSGLVVRALSVVVLRIFGPVGRMAERNALRNPRRTGATGAALMIGLALVACLSVVGASMVSSASDELDKSVGADFIVQSDTGQLIVPQVVERMRGVDELQHVTDYKLVESTVRTDDGKKSDKTMAAASPSYAEDVQTDTVAGNLADAYQPDSMSVDEKFAEEHGVKVGDRLAVDFDEGTSATLTVRAVTTSDSVIDGGAWYISVDTAEQYLDDGKLPPNFITFAQAKDGQEEAAYAALKAELEEYPQYQVRDQADYKKLLEDQIGQLLNMVYGLLALAIIVAILGVVNTLALSVVERTREIGLMRAIGLSRRQLRRMIRLESVVIALFGALLGLGLGIAWGVSAQQLLALEGLKVLEIPWSTILTVFVGSALVGLVAALVPAFRAGRMNVLNAIATD